MKFIEKSSADDYARAFWAREKQKRQRSGQHFQRDHWERISANPLEEMKQPASNGGHPYKLPPAILNKWGVWQLTEPSELFSLMVKQDEYMQVRDLGVNPLGNVARRAIHTNFFATENGGTQVRLYREWSKEGFSLNEVIKDNERLCLRTITDKERMDSPTSQFYIVDGWGRSLPYLTLVLQGKEFYPIEVYIAE